MTTKIAKIPKRHKMAHIAKIKG